MTVAELLVFLNADRARSGLPPGDRWWARRICHAMGIRFFQEAPGCVLRASGSDLVRSGFWGALKRGERRAREDDEE